MNSILLKAPWWNEQHAPDKAWPTAGMIQFYNYSTRYRPGLELVLKGITCSICSGEKVCSLYYTISKPSIVLSKAQIKPSHIQDHHMRIQTIKETHPKVIIQ